MKTKNKLALLLCVILVLPLLFSGCSVKEDSVESRTLCETMLNHIIQNDYESAYQMVQAVATENEFQMLWNTMRIVLKNSTSYELQQKNWYQQWSNGVKTTQVLFEITTDDGKTCQMLIYTRDGIEGIAGLNFLDSTAFVKKTESLKTVNIFLIVFSIACFAFSIWMFVDCLKRCKKYKVLWAILTLFSAGFALTTGNSNFGFHIRFTLLAAITNISADRAALTITLTAFLPLGAIIYCLMRKRLARTAETITETASAEHAVSEHTEETEV
jgi:hypothetical protein